MKNVLIIVFMSLFYLSAEAIVQSAAFAQDPGTEIKNEDISSFLEKIWIKIRTLSPKKRNRSSGSAVAGVKGAEKGSEELKPYWKGEEADRSEAEIERYMSAEDLLEKGNYAEALVAFKSFREDFSKSRHFPMAVFSEGICLLKLGQNIEAASLLENFISAYPEHDLVPEAKKILQLLDAKRT